MATFCFSAVLVHERRFKLGFGVAVTAPSRTRRLAPVSVLRVIRPKSLNTGRHSVTNLAVHIRVDFSRRFSELAVFDARLYIRVRRIDEPA